MPVERADIYLDHAATTPVDQRVLEAMIPFFNSRFGNPSSPYALGRDARAAVDWARGTLAAIINCAPSELTMTSGATESDNIAVKGVAWRSRDIQPQRNRILVSAIEHHAVLHAADAMSAHGFVVDVVQPDSEGIVQPEAVAEMLSPETCLVSIMLANNEIGTLNPIAEIGKITRKNGVLLHTDAVQAAGKIPFDVVDTNVVTAAGPSP